MQARRSPIPGAAALVLLGALARVASATPSEEPVPIVSPYGQLFPALVLATSAAEAPLPAARGAGSGEAPALGDRDGLVGARLVARADGEPVTLRIRIPELDANGELSTTLARAGTRYDLFPRMRWNAARLAAAGAGATATLELGIARAGSPEQVFRSTLGVHALGEAPYYLADGPRSADLGWIFAAFVDERDPIVAPLLDEARTLSGEVFPGYAGGDADEAERQVFALWYALERRGLRYSPLTDRRSVGGHVYVQRVRSLAQSLEDRAANCVDGSVLMASLLGAVELDAALVRVPGHMFLQVALDRAGTRHAYLETTLLNDPRVATDSRAGAAPERDASWRRFQAALASGERQYQRARRELERGRSPEYRVIEIAEARRLGVRAISAAPPAPAAGEAAPAAGY